MPFVESLLKDTTIEAVNKRIATNVLGPLICKNKKLWKELSKLAQEANEQLRRAAVHATMAPVTTDNTVFNRFEELVTPLLAEEDPLLQTVIDEVLSAASETHEDAVAAFANEHDRKLK
jgi:3-methyladenine DNA glycosylase AlkD